jgi:STE24 endopeptidase
MTWNGYTALFLALFASHHGFEALLDLLQLRYLKRLRNRVPSHLEGKVDVETIQKARAYNRDRLWWGLVSTAFDITGVWVMIGLGFAWLDRTVSLLELGPTLSGLAFFGALGLLGFFFGLPMQLVSTFVVEQKHGFNRRTPLGFVSDTIKGLLVSAVLGAALVSVVLFLMQNGGAYWWLIAFVAVTVLQLLAAWLYPIVIMPIFNKFTPVSEDLAADVSGLAKKVGFPLKSVFSMDGSKRSAHSNAFIVGLKGARKIVLFDTLIDQITRPQLIAVLAHELGHFKLRHLTKRLVLTVASLLGMFFILGYLRDIEPLYNGLGFERVTDHAALIVFSLLVAEAAAPFGWLLRAASRRDERAADRFAVDSVENGADLRDALIALNKENLGSPGSHKLYRSYYNSHPALKDRLKAIRGHAESRGLPLETVTKSEISDV